MEIIEAVKEYQCSGCVGGPFENCFESKKAGDGCSKHVCGTTLIPIGRIFLGLPKGFNRKGDSERTDVSIFKSYDDALTAWGYNWLNIAVWKYLDEFGNTIVRGLSPRINYSWVHVILGDCLDKFDCYEVTKTNMDEID